MKNVKLNPKLFELAAKKVLPCGEFNGACYALDKAVREFYGLNSTSSGKGAEIYEAHRQFIKNFFEPTQRDFRSVEKNFDDYSGDGYQIGSSYYWGARSRGNQQCRAVALLLAAQ